MEIKDLIPANWLKDESKKGALSFYSPLRKMRNDINGMFNEFLVGDDDLWTSNKRTGLFAPKSDIIETKSEYKVFMDVPGVEEKDVEVSIDSGALQISGNKEYSDEFKDSQVHTIERSSGSFIKTLALPNNVLQDQIKASFKNGVLEVIIPKTEESKRNIKKITIDSK